MTQASTNSTFHRQTNQVELARPVDANSVEFLNVLPPDLTTNAKRIWIEQLSETLNFTVDGVDIHTIADRIDLGFVNVKWFGARGNNLADDTLTIQAALDYINSVGGGTLFFPPGIYLISSKLSFHSNTVVWGYNATVKLKAGVYSALVTMFTSFGFVNGAYNPATPIVENVTFLGLTIDGNLANITTTDSCTGINAYKVQNFTVRDVKIVNLPGIIGNGYGIITWYSNKVNIDNVEVDTTDRQNITIWETLDAHISNCTLNFSYFRDCILVSGNSPFSLQASHCTVVNNKCTNNSTTGTHVIRFAGSSSGVIRNNQITGNLLREAIYFVCDDNIYIECVGNEISNCLYGVLAEHDGLGQTFIVSNNKIIGCNDGVRFNLIADRVTITNNSILSTVVRPLFVSSVKQAVITGNIIDGGSTSLSLIPTTTMDFSGNTIRNLTDASFAALINSSGSVIPTISGNTVENNTVNDLRVLIDAKVVGNRANINSTTAHVNFLNSRAVTYMSNTPPSSGTWVQGDIVYNTASSLGGIDHWRCTTGGTPGTWTPHQVGVLSSIAATPLGVGFHALSGGQMYISIATTAPTDWKQIT